MSTLTYEAGYSLFERVPNTGVSEASRQLEGSVSKYFQHFREGAERQQAFNELAGAVQGENAKLESADIHPLACRFLNSLPSSLPSPSIQVDSDGEISFDWILGRNRMLTVTLGSYGKLSYAGIFGQGKKQHGVETFDDAIPETIIRCIERVQA